MPKETYCQALKAGATEHSLGPSLVRKLGTDDTCSVHSLRASFHDIGNEVLQSLTFDLD